MRVVLTLALTIRLVRLVIVLHNTSLGSIQIMGGFSTFLMFKNILDCLFPPKKFGFRKSTFRYFNIWILTICLPFFNNFFFIFSIHIVNIYNLHVFTNLSVWVSVIEIEGNHEKSSRIFLFETLKDLFIPFYFHWLSICPHPWNYSWLFYTKRRKWWMK